MCQLSKQGPNGTLVMVTWIRSEIAIAGKTLNRLKDAGTGVIRDGWHVDSVGSSERSETFLLGRSRAHLKTRKASDI